MYSKSFLKMCDIAEKAVIVREVAQCFEELYELYYDDEYLFYEDLGEIAIEIQADEDVLRNNRNHEGFSLEEIKFEAELKIERLIKERKK